MENLYNRLFWDTLLNKHLTNVFTLIKSTRLQRPLIPLSFMMIAAGFANHINTDILILGLCCLLIYASGGILNAKVDGDFKLKQTSLIISILITLAIIISLKNYIIFIAVLGWIILSYIYSKHSRKILFGDSIILSITHAALPVFTASMILKLNILLALKLSIFSFIAFFSIVPMKNLNGIKEDKKRKYKTLMTKYKGGKSITKILFDFYFVLMLIAYFLFDLGNKYIAAFVVLLTFKILMDLYFNNKKEIMSYELLRLLLISFSFAFVFDLTSNTKIILLSSALIIAYLFYLAIDINQGGQKWSITML